MLTSISTVKIALNGAWPTISNCCLNLRACVYCCSPFIQTMIFIVQPKLISTDHLNNRKHFAFSNLWANLVHFLLQISLLKWSSRTWEESKAMITKRCVSLVVLRIFVPHCILYVCILYNSLYGITCSITVFFSLSSACTLMMSLQPYGKAARECCIITTGTV